MSKLANVSLSEIAVFTVFSNFVLNSAIAFVIWWRVLRPFAPRTINLTVRDSPYNTTFKLTGMLFTVLACIFLLASMWRASDISWKTYTHLQVLCNSLFFFVSLYAAYSMIHHRMFRWIIPTTLGAGSMALAATYVSISV